MYVQYQLYLMRVTLDSNSLALHRKTLNGASMHNTGLILNMIGIQRGGNKNSFLNCHGKKYNEVPMLKIHI